MSALSALNFSGRHRLPAIQSAEAAECGLACMAMVARYHGHDLDLNTLRQTFPASMAGATLRGLMQLAEHLKLASRPLRAELDGLAHVQTPAILHWDLNHFVVLKSVRAGRLVVHDPAVGVRILTLAEASRHFTGVVLELTPTPLFKPLVARTPVRLSSLWSGMMGAGPAMLQILGLSLALQITAFAAPFQMQLVIDEGVMRGDADLLVVIALGFGGLLILQASIDALRNWLLQVFGQMLSFQMVGNIVHHLIRLPAAWFEKRAIGDVLSRVSSAVAIQNILTQGVIGALIDGLMAMAAILILFLYSPQLAAVVLAAVGLSVLVAVALFPMIRARSELHIVEQAREQTQVMETIRAATTIKVMGREAEREAVWRNLFANAVNAGVSVAKFEIGLKSLQTLITGLQTVVVIYLAARMIVGGEGFSLGMMIAFLSFRQTFTDRANALISQAIQFRLITLHLDRLSDIVTAERDPTPAWQPGLAFEGGLALTGVGFRYGATDRSVFEDLNLVVRPGEYVAITGPSGGGKTTLLKLLLGLHHPTSGEILLDQDVATPERWRAWRQQIGLVAQDDRLLSGSIADNIAFFDPDLDMQRVKEAASEARVHDDIAQMPMQYLSLVGDMGSALSGGQKQRILLARALYRQPRILILDEGTANLDVATEVILAERLAQMDITRIVVAHRPALLERADRVLVLDEGKLTTRFTRSPEFAD